MKKTLLILPIIALMSNFIHADTDKIRFGGILASTKKIDLKNFMDQDDATIGLRFGLQDKNWRAMITAEADQRGYRSFSLETDKLSNTLTVANLSFKAYTGVSIGYIDHKKESRNQAIFGLHIGTLLYLDKNTDLDISVSHLEKRKSSEIEGINSVTLALHYYF